MFKLLLVDIQENSDIRPGNHVGYHIWYLLDITCCDIQGDILITSSQIYEIQNCNIHISIWISLFFIGEVSPKSNGEKGLVKFIKGFFFK